MWSGVGEGGSAREFMSERRKFVFVVNNIFLLKIRRVRDNKKVEENPPITIVSLWKYYLECVLLFPDFFFTSRINCLFNKLRSILSQLPTFALWPVSFNFLYYVFQYFRVVSLIFCGFHTLVSSSFSTFPNSSSIFFGCLCLHLSKC